jgi:DNA helicase-2/ATP-dependent DNA helicase PcrA
MTHTSQPDLFGAKDLHAELNAEQLEAVNHPGGPQLVIAGAGTGKTKVITHRIARLIERGADPASILALTFTEKSALEMEERVDLLVPYGYSNVHISTFHSFGESVLRDHALSIGLDPGYKILSEAETVIFLKENIYKIPLDRFRPAGNPGKYLSALIRFIGRLKDEAVEPETFGAHVEELRAKGPAALDDPKDIDEESFADLLSERTELSGAYAEYQRLMAEAGYMDFADLIMMMLKLFRTRPNTLRRCRERYRHILTDEFQDTNYAQFELLKMLAGEPGNITVVADDDQSIYKFRGAAVSNILAFLDHYDNAKVVTLKKNYRTLQPILDAAYRLITKNNPERLEVVRGIDKRLVSVRETPPEARPVRHVHLETQTDEAAFVADTINERVNGVGVGGGVAGGARYRDFAVLVRARTDAGPILAALDAGGIPYHYSGKTGLYRREEISVLLAFLKIITNFTDSLSLFHLARSNIYGLTAADLTPCNTLARRSCKPLLHVMKGVAEGRALDYGLEISESGAEIITRLVSDIKLFSEMALDEPAGTVLYKFLADSGVFERLKESEDPARAADEAGNISRFFSIVTHLQETLSIKKTSVLVAELQTLLEAGDDPDSTTPELADDTVQVLTVHKAKGLEFPVVFMVSLIKDRFPGKNRSEALEPPSELINDPPPSREQHLQEERRLFYVGMTRARDELFLMSASDYGGARRRLPSRFIIEALDMPEPEKPPRKPKGDTPKPDTKERPTVPAGAEPLHLSYYKTNDYLSCPLRYRYGYILRIPVLPNPALMYGSAVHEAVSFLLRGRLDGRRPAEDDLIKVFKGAWRNAGFSSREHGQARFDAGIETLKRFYTDSEDIRPKAVERAFAMKFEGALVKGRWDLIAERGDGDWIVDFKTSDIQTQKKADKSARDSAQLKLYALAHKKAFGAAPAGGELWFVESGLRGATAFKEKDLEKAAEMIEEAADGIRRKDFNAKPNYLHCGWCDFKDICPDRLKSAK